MDEDGVEAWRWQWDGNSNCIGALDVLNPAGEITPADIEIDAQDRLLRYGDETFAARSSRRSEPGKRTSSSPPEAPP